MGMHEVRGWRKDGARGDCRKFWLRLSTVGSIVNLCKSGRQSDVSLMINEIGQSLKIMIILAGITIPILINRDAIAPNELFYLVKSRFGYDHVEFITAASKGSPFFNHVRFIH